MDNLKSIPTDSDTSKCEPLKMTDSVGTFIFSPEDINLVLREIGKNVRKFRMKYGISIGQLADLAGITKATLYKIESGSTGIGLVVLLKISYVLQLPLDNFIPFLYPDSQDSKKRKSLGERIDEISYGTTKEAKLFILNFVKNFVKYECVSGNGSKSSGKEEEPYSDKKRECN